MLTRHDIGLLSTLVMEHMQKLRQRRGESPADFEFRREAYKPLLRKLEQMYEGTNDGV